LKELFVLWFSAGLGSILFAISFDRAELNGSKPAKGFSLLHSKRSAQTAAAESANDPCPVVNAQKCMWLHS